MTRSFPAQGGRFLFHWVRAASLGLFALFALGSAFAAFPEKPIRLVVAFPPGSSTDIVRELLGKKCRSHLVNRL